MQTHDSRALPEKAMTTRRNVLRGAAAFTIGAPTIMGAAVAYDPIIGAIQHYKDAVQALADSASDDEAVTAALAEAINAPQAVLENWDSPTLSREGALAALRTAERDLRDYMMDGPAPALIAAALAYFELQQ